MNMRFKKFIAKCWNEKCIIAMIISMEFCPSDFWIFLDI